MNALAMPASVRTLPSSITAPQTQHDREAWKYSPLERFLPQGTAHTQSLSINTTSTAVTTQTSDTAQLGEQLCVQAAPNGQRIDVPANSTDQAPITIDNQHIAGTTANHVHLHIGANAHVTLIERHSGEHEGRNLFHLTVELGDGAQLTHIQQNMQSEQATQLISVRAIMGNNSQYNHWYGALSGGLKRLDFHPIVKGRGATFTSHGLFLARNQDIHDHYFPILHPKHDSKSTIHYRGVLQGKSKGIIYSRAEVPAHATGNEAHQHAKALLLSERAQAVLRPELAIDCDDVICSHGAATGMLDDDALHYLQARGLNNAEARQLLVQGFVGEIVDALPAHTADTNNAIRTIVDAWLASDGSV